MLLRTSSNPSILTGAPSPSGLKGVEMESPSHLSKPFSSHPLVHLGTVEKNGQQWDFEGDVVPWPQFRRAQSENDLQTTGILCAFPARFVAENFTMQEQRVKSFKTPQKQWSRRTSLRRHSSLPTIASTSDLLEQILPPLTDVVEASSDTEVEENPQVQNKQHKSVEHEEARQMGGASVSGRWEGRCFKDQDGEVYSGVSKDADGNTLLCSSKGCRPLHESEKGVPMFMAGDLGSGNGVGRGNAHAYFRGMLDTNPGEPLLLRNYARYLYEVLHDHSKAEEYYERAILANPNEGELLAEYAKLEWELHGDEERAGNYFDQAVQAAPDNCYVLGAYAAFMWACEEKEAEKKQASFEKFERYATAVA